MNSYTERFDTERFASKVLLIDDQEIIARAIEGMLKPAKEIAFFYCSHPTEAIKMASKVFPTVILLDLVMPDVDGLTLLRYLRANPATREVPIIVLSQREDPSSKVVAFAYGANDYLVKLPDKLELIARIRYHSEAYIRLLERNQAYVELQQSQQKLQGELNEAAEFVRTMIPKQMEHPYNISWKFIPSQQLGGDAFGYHWIDDDHLGIYLLDVCGHGIGAALLSVSVLTILRFQQLINVDFLDPKSILKELSRVFLMKKQNYVFFTLWYGVVSRSKRDLVFSSGGHPPAVLVTGNEQKTSTVKELPSQGPIIGIDPDAPYTNQVLHFERFNKLFIFSDGVYEIEKKNHEFLDIDEYIDVVKKTAKESDNSIEELFQYAKNINIKDNFDDDYSMIQFVISY